MLQTTLASKRQMADRIAVGYHYSQLPGDKQRILEQIVDVWVSQAPEFSVRRYALEFLYRLDPSAAPVVLGSAYRKQENVERMRQAAACLAVIEHEGEMRHMVHKLMRGAIIWSVKEDNAERQILQPLLQRMAAVQLTELQHLGV